MGQRDTMLRSMHDAGLAAWFGGSLMGAVGLNGAAEKVSRRDERLKISSVGWRRWAPVNLAAIGTHLAGASALLATQRYRVAGQRGVLAMSAAKTGLTLAALGATAYAGALGMRLGKAGEVPAEGPTRAAEDTPDEVSAIQRRQRVVQWTVPAFTGALVAISSLAGEQQRPASVMRGMMGRMGSLRNVGRLGSLAATGMGSLGSLGALGNLATTGMGNLGSLARPMIAVRAARLMPDRGRSRPRARRAPAHTRRA